MEQQIQLAGGQINYTDEGGKGTALILLHGFCESLHIWDDWQDDALEEGYRVLRIDLPGFGGSDAPLFSMEEMATAVLAVAEQSKLKQAVLLGHSMGGYVGLAVAAREPDWLIGLGLFHSHPFQDNPEQQENRQKAIDFISKNGHVHYVKQLIPRLFAPDAGTSASFRRDLMILRASRSKSSSIQQVQKAMAARLDYSEVLANFQQPVLFINGANDPIYTDQQRQEQLALPPVSQLCLLQRAGHMGMIEEAAITQKAVRRFMAFCEEWAGKKQAG